MSLLVAAFATLSYADLDETLVAPEASVVFYVHGHLNLVFTSNDTTVAYANFVASSTETAFAYDVEIRPAGGGEETWTSHGGSLSKYASVSSREFRDTSRFFWLGSSEIDSSVEVRARIRITKEGDAKCGAWSAWRNLGTADVLDEVNGTVIQSNPSRAGDADDGDLNTFYEDTSSPAWTGLDAGSEAVVSRIRFTHRNFNSIAQDRGKGAVFEAANNADFSDAVQLSVVPNDYNPFAVNDISLETPVRARYFRVRAAFCNFTEVQWIGYTGCPAALAGDGGESDYRARVAASGSLRAISSLRLLRGYFASGPYAAITSTLPVSEPLVVVDEASGVGLPCHYCWECTLNSGVVLTGAVSSVYIRPRQLERDAADQTALGEGVALLPANTLFPGKTFSKANTVGDAFDGDLETSPNSYTGTTNPVVGVSLPAPAHLACVFVNADCQNSIRASRMTRLALYSAESITSLNGGEYVQLAAPITTYQQSDDRQWFRYNSTDTNSLFACLFGYAPGNDATSGQWCGHAREIRFVGWTEADAIASGKVLAPEGVAVAYGNGAVTVSWTAAVNASSLSIERRQQEDGDWTVVATDVDPSALSCVDGSKPRGGQAYDYRVRATGLGGLMSAEAEPVSVEIPKKGFAIVFM